MKTTIKLKYAADEKQLALLRKCASICGQRSMADFFGFAVTEYCHLLLGSIEVERERAEADRAAKQNSVAHLSPSVEERDGQGDVTPVGSGGGLNGPEIGGSGD